MLAVRVQYFAGQENLAIANLKNRIIEKPPQLAKQARALESLLAKMKARNLTKISIPVFARLDDQSSVDDQADP
jgi:hypothetical protein